MKYFSPVPNLFQTYEDRAFIWSGSAKCVKCTMSCMYILNLFASLFGQSDGCNIWQVLFELNNEFMYGLRTPNKAFFHWNPELLGLGRQIGQINSGAFGVFSAKLSAPILVQWVSCPCFPLFKNYFYKKTKPLYPHPKYLFGIGIWVWAKKD